MLPRHGHRQAEREPTRNAVRAGALAERCLRGEDIRTCAGSPRNG